MRHLLAGSGLCLLTLLAYSNSFSAGFALDNKGLLLQDARVREATAQNLDLILQHTYWWPYGESGLYRPFTTLSYLFNYAVLGNTDHPAGYHWINFLLHACNVLLLYALARRMIHTPGAFWPPALAAALWAVHPVLTESVTNIVGRADLLAGMALLSGFLMYLKSTEAAGWRQTAWLAGLMAVTTVGVFSKESAVTILGVIALYEFAWWSRRRQVRGLFLACLAVLPPIQWMLYQRSRVLFSSAVTLFPFTDNPLVDADFWTGRITALKVIARYLGLLLFPATLSCDYSWAQIPLADGSAADWLACAAVLALVAGVVLLFRWNRAAFFAAGSAAVVFLPTSNLLFPIGAIMAERFLYLPCIAFAAAAVGSVYALCRRTGFPAAAPLLLGLITAGLAIRTWVRNSDWRSDLTLAAATVEASPRSFKAHKLLALALHESDSSPANLDRVIVEAERSLAPLAGLTDSRNNADAWFRTANYYSEKGDLLRRLGAPGSAPESVQAYQRSLQLLQRCDRIVKAWDARALELERMRGRADSALDQSRYADLQLRISTAWLRLSSPEKAFDAAVLARRLDPGNAAIHRQLSDILIANRRVDEAAAVLMEGVLVTSDLGLRNELLNLYRSGLDSQHCATTPGDGVSDDHGGALNPSCEIVRRHLCAAAAGTIQLRLETGRADLAQSMKETALRDFGCPAWPLDQILPLPR